LALARQPMAVGRALEESRADGALELANVAPDRRLPQPERARRLAQAPGLSDREEHPQIVPVHAASLASPRVAEVRRIRSTVLRNSWLVGRRLRVMQWSCGREAHDERERVPAVRRRDGENAGGASHG